MPIPKPKKNEKKQEYMGRCMSFMKHEGKWEDRDQQIAICISTFERINESKEITGKNLLNEYFAHPPYYNDKIRYYKMSSLRKALKNVIGYDYPKIINFIKQDRGTDVLFEEDYLLYVFDLLKIKYKFWNEILNQMNENINEI